MKSNKNLRVNIAFGIIFGVVLGLILDSLGLWISLGTMFGIARANYLSSREKVKIKILN
jgi:Na+/H+-dicarboxylate symporter